MKFAHVPRRPRDRRGYAENLGRVAVARLGGTLQRTRLPGESTELVVDGHRVLVGTDSVLAYGSSTVVHLFNQNDTAQLADAAAFVVFRD